MVAEVVRPLGVTELADFVREAKHVSVVGADGHRGWRYDRTDSGVAMSTSGLTGIVSLEPADQVVIVRAGTPVSELNHELKQIGQTIPFAPFEADDDPTIGGALSLALPHRLEAQCGTWRDWTLGMTVVRADGAVAKCGSSAVKNVAGYDVGRLFIGARGVIGVIAEVILRTFPIKAMPEALCDASNSGSASLWVQRVRLGDLTKLEAPGVIDPATATLWAPLAADQVRPRLEMDWVTRRGGGLTDFRPGQLLQAAKDRFDPTRKFNPGALGE